MTTQPDAQRHHLAALRHAFALALDAAVQLQRAQAIARLAQLPPPAPKPADRARFVEANIPAWRAYWQANARARMDFNDNEASFLSHMAQALTDTQPSTSTKDSANVS